MEPKTAALQQKSIKIKTYSLRFSSIDMFYQNNNLFNGKDYLFFSSEMIDGITSYKSPSMA